jgi:predicted phosphodiesterase
MRMMIKRAKSKKIADLILTADLHLTTDAPVSRTDDYIAAQEKKLLFLRRLSAENGNCPILCAGDIFDYWKASPWLCSWVHRHLPENLITIPGNHDLPMHSFQQYEKSALHLIETVGRKIEVLKGVEVEGTCCWEVNRNFHHFHIIGIPFGGLKNEEDLSTHTRSDSINILLIHEMVWLGRNPAWSPNSFSSQELLEKYGEYFDLIVTGDNHMSFTDKKGNSLLVNPGSMMRITADQTDFHPQCYLYYADEGSATPVPFPIQKNVHRRDHLDKKKARDERISAFIEQIKNDGWDRGLSFRDNLQAFFEENRTPKKVREIIWQHLETEEMM